MTEHVEPNGAGEDSANGGEKKHLLREHGVKAQMMTHDPIDLKRESSHTHS